MTSPIKISSLELENVKRIRAVELEPTKDGLTVIGGRNAQGKTSVLDAIAWALGGEKMRPASPNRDGSANPAHLLLRLSNGITVERKGKNGALYVTDTTGRRAGQTLLNEFIGQLALNMPKFLECSDKERANYLLDIIGVGDELTRLDNAVQDAYDERRSIGQMHTRKAKAAEELPYYEDAPSEPVSVAELVKQQQEILARNGENQRKREQVEQIRRDMNDANREVNRIDVQIGDLEGRIDELKLAQKKQMELRDGLLDDLMAAEKTAEELTDESTAEIEESIAQIEQTNAKVTANRTYLAAKREADQLKGEYDGMTERIEELRRERTRLLDDANMPLDGLTVEGGLLVYNGHVWSDMSSAEQMRVATAIVRATKPSCGFVLVDKLEQMDAETLSDFGAWCQREGLQVIGTRVATDDSCTVVIEDGRVVGAEVRPEQEPEPEGGRALAWGGDAF